MFFEYLDKIRQFNNHKKKFIAFSLSLILTGIIAVLWITFWFPVDVQKIKKENQSFKKENTKFSDLKNDVSELVQVLNKIRKSNFSSTIDYSQTDK